MKNQNISEFDQETVQKYLKKSSLFCPYCGSEDVQDDGCSGSVLEHFDFFTCNNCHDQWVEEWKNTLPQEEIRDILNKMSESVFVGPSETWFAMSSVLQKACRLVGIYPNDSEDEEE
jgi:hypothetical protein